MRIAPAAALAIVVVTSGCGGGSATAPTSTGGDAVTLGASVGGIAPPATRPDVPFPATDGNGVLALAGLRPTGRVTYKVQVGAATGQPAITFDLELASNDRASRLHQSQASGDLWVGFDIPERRIAWVCTAVAGAAPACHRDDPDGAGARATAAITRLVGNDEIVTTFSPLVGAPGAGVGVDQQAGVDVSCLAGTIQSQDLRLCATRDGFITEMHDGTTALIALSATTTTSQSDLDPPVALQ